VVYKAPVADAASDTQLVRLEVPNPNLRDTGLQALVNLPDNIAGEGGASPAGPAASALPSGIPAAIPAPASR
jgi:hypothetical protein